MGFVDGVFGITFQKTSLTNNMSRIAGISGLNSLHISAISITYLLKVVNFRRSSLFLIRFLIYSMMVWLRARLLPITSGQSILRLFGGKPILHSVYNNDDLILIPLLLCPSFCNSA